MTMTMTEHRPEHVTKGIQAAIEATREHYPCTVELRATELRELPADDPDRVFEYTCWHDGSHVRLEYTHSLVVYYTPRYAAMYGITPEGDAHLWCD